MRFRMGIFISILLTYLNVCQPPLAQQTPIHHLNKVAEPPASQTIAIVGATLIDGHGNLPIEDSIVIIKGNKITKIGRVWGIDIPEDAQVYNAEGKTLLPGLIDSHYHLGRNAASPQNFLKHGVTSIRDPGAWIEKWQPTIHSIEPVPRLYLTGPHLDDYPPAYPQNSILLRDEDETRAAVNRFIDQGASAIKVYFRLTLANIRAACETAHARGIPVTAHLEIVDARDAIHAGLDGIEHVTSVGSAMLNLREMEQWRQAMITDNNYRREGRFEMWSRLDLESEQAKELVQLIVDRGVYFSATLGAFERREGDDDTTEMHVKGFENMMEFTGMVRRAGGKVTTGSHTWVRHAEGGWAFQREMELLVESGLTPMETIVASTMENARFFRIEEKLGSINVGKLADLVIVDGNPLDDIKAMYSIERVMLNGNWIE